MRYTQLLDQASALIDEIMPWDFDDYFQNNQDALIIDVRETHEYARLRIKHSITVPRGILENACSWGFTETVPLLASAKQRPLLIICRSGHRSTFAARVLNQLGFESTTSLKLGLKGLNDEDHPIFDSNDERLDADLIEQWLNPAVLEEQTGPQ